MNIDEIIKEIDKSAELPFITAQFGNEWRDWAKDNLTISALLDIAWKQGRKNILLENKFREVISKERSIDFVNVMSVVKPVVSIKMINGIKRVHIQIYTQGFALYFEGSDEELEWYADMTRKALSRLQAKQ